MEQMNTEETNRNTAGNVYLDSTQLQAILRSGANNILLLNLCKFKETRLLYGKLPETVHVDSAK